MLEGINVGLTQREGLLPTPAVNEGGVPDRVFAFLLYKNQVELQAPI